MSIDDELEAIFEVIKSLLFVNDHALSVQQLQGSQIVQDDLTAELTNYISLFYMSLNLKEPHAILQAETEMSTRAVQVAQKILCSAVGLDALI